MGELDSFYKRIMGGGGDSAPGTSASASGASESSAIGAYFESMMKKAGSRTPEPAPASTPTVQPAAPRGPSQHTASSHSSLSAGADFDTVEQKKTEIDAQIKEARQQRNRATAMSGRLFSDVSSIPALDKQISDLEAQRRSVGGLYTDAYSQLFNADDFAAMEKAGAEHKSYADIMRPRDTAGLNKVRYAEEHRDDIVASRSDSSALSQRQREYDNLWNMTDDEKQMYNYLLASRGDKAADDFLDYMRETLNARSAQQTAASIEADSGVSRLARQGAAAVESGWGGAMQGIKQNFHSDALPTSESEFLGQMVRQNIEGHDGPQVFGRSLEGLGFDATQTVANMAPSLAASVLNPAAGAVAIGASSKGQAYKRALDDGYTKEQAEAYSTIIGAAEAGLQYLLGGIKAFGGITRYTDKLTSKIGSRWLRAAAELGIENIGEFNEEYLQNKLDPLLRNMLFGEENKIALWDDQDVDTALITILTTTLLNSGNTVSTITTGKAGAAIIRQGVQGNVIDAALATPASSRSHALAEAMKNGSTPVTDVSMGELMLALESETGQSAKVLCDAITEQKTESAAKTAPDAQQPSGDVVTPAAAQSASTAQTDALNSAPQLTPAQQVQQMLMQPISNKQAERMLADEQVRETLLSLGIDLSGTKSEQRAAIKEAAQEVQSRAGEIYAKLQSLIPGLPGENVTHGAAEPSQQNIDNTAAQGYDNSIGNVSIGGEQDARETDAGRGAAADRNGVPGVYEGRDADDTGRRGFDGAPVNSGLVLLSPEDQSTLQQSGVYSQMQDASANGAAFSAALDEARASDAANGWAVTPKSAEEFAASGARLYMSSDGSTGFAIAPDGDIEALFSNKPKGAPKGVSRSVLPQAVMNGGTKMDCYGPNLVRIYAKHGFVPVARVTFNPEYANPGWDASKGSPDIYFMMYKGGDPSTLVQRYGTFPEITKADLDALPVMEYDEAYAYRDSLLAQQGQSTETETALAPADASTPAAQTAPGNNVPAVPGQTEQNGLLPGQKRSQTESNTLSGIAEKLGGEQAPLYYTPITERQTLNEAVNRVAADFVGAMNTLLDKDMWTAADIDTGLTIYGKLMADAVSSGDNSAAAAWSKIVQEHGTRSGQALQAFGKWTRSGQGMAAQAQSLLADYAETPAGKKLSPETISKISNDIYDFGVAFDNIQEGDTESLRDLILRQNDYRNTGTFGEGNFEKLLDEVDDYDWLREFALRQMMNIAADTTETADLGQKAKTWQVSAQLSRLGTFFRNIGGNVMFGVQDTLTQNGLGIALDMLASKATGHRTVGLDKSYFSSDVRKAMRDAYVRSVLEVSGDVDMSDGSSKYGQTANRTFKMSGSTFDRFMSRWEQLLGYSLTTSDRVSRGGIEAAVRQGLEGIENSGLGENDIQELAEGTADYRLFQNKGTAYKISKGVHDVLNILGIGGEVRGVTRTGGFGLGDLVNPYPGVPANLAVKALEYSPANIIKGGVEFVQLLQDMKAGDFSATKQNKAVMDVARGLAGTPIIALLAAAFKSGIVRNSDDEEDPDAAAQARAEGRQGVQINLDAWQRAMSGGSAEWKSGDDLMTVSWLEPLNAFMAIASLIASDGEDATLDSMAKNYFSGTLQGVLDMPVMANIANAIDTFRYSTGDNIGAKVGDAALSLAGDAFTGMLPAPISQAARTFDKSFRDTSADTTAGRVWNSVRNTIPGLRETLPVKQDNFGDAKEYSSSFLQRFLNNFVLPGSVSELKQSEAAAELQRLYESTKEASVYPDRQAPKSVAFDGEKMKLSTEERQTYHQTYGQTYAQALTGWMEDGSWGQLSESDQVKLLQSLNEYARDKAKRELVTSRGGEYESDWDKVELLRDPEAYLAAKTALTSALESKDYKKVDELLKIGGMYTRLSIGARRALDSGKTEQLDKMAEAARIGISSKRWMEAYDKRKQLNEQTGLSASQKATQFLLWTRTLPFSEKQRSLLGDQLGFYSMVRGNTDRIEALLDAGLSDRNAETVFGIIGDLKPLPGKSSVTQQQKVEAIVGSNLSDEAKWAAFEVYATDALYQKALAAKQRGKSLAQFLAEYYG